MATKWSSRAPNATLVIDIGKSWSVTQITIHHAEAGGEANLLNTRDFTIELSSDDKHWSRIATVEGNHDSVTQHTIPPTPASAVRIVVLKPNQGVDTETRIYEVEVYGTKVNAPR